jgi:three-Cys-motif partner protein
MVPSNPRQMRVPEHPSVKVHTFGGLWTERKLAALEGYLTAYKHIFDKGRWASKYKTIYVDGFAGTGERTEADHPEPNRSVDLNNQSDLFAPEPGGPENRQQRGAKRGSARVALELASPFDQYLFVEANVTRASQLKDLIQREEYRALDARIEVGDANEVISTWCSATDWHRSRAVVFLDPYGMSVEWSTIERIARTSAIDLWILFPLGAGINRMLTRGKKPPPSWITKIDRILGTDAWQEIFYKELVEQGLFGEEVTRIVKTATFATMTKFFLERLESVFEAVSPEAMALTNSRGNPLYMLCFAAGNKVGAPIAVKIANHLLKD